MSSRVAFYEQWRDLMRSWGFTVLEAEGWRTRDAEPRTSYDPTQVYLEHHDASTKLSGNWGALAYILRERLANIVTARDGQIMLCSAGVAWHAGVGAYPGLPTNAANRCSLGNEACNSGTGEDYPPAQTRSIIAGEAAWAIVAGRGVDRIIGHKEWAMPRGRKKDPTISMSQRRADVAAWIAGLGGDDDMGYSLEQIAKAVWDHPINKVGDGPASVGPANAAMFLQHTAYHATNSSNGVGPILGAIAGIDIDADAEEVASALAPHLGEILKALPAAQLADIAKVVNDEADRRDRDGDPTTGQAS